MVQLKGAFLRLVTVQYRNTSICLGDQVEVDYVTRSPCDGISQSVTAPATAELSPFRPTFHRRDTQCGTVRGGAEFPRVSHKLVVQ